jgi:alkylated DNA repair dioxygenase AlkB
LFVGLFSTNAIFPIFIQNFNCNLLVLMSSMKLFDDDSVNVNLLPFDGEAMYYGKIIDYTDANYYFKLLKEHIAWRNDEVLIFGKHIVTKRKTAWYGDEDFEYIYSRIGRKALPWTAELLAIKSMVEKITGSKYNSCLLNLYNNGDEGMGWHSDDESTMSPDNPIASISLGVARKFVFKHKQTKELVSVNLENGSLLLMKGATQKNWYHALPKSKKITNTRINLTFRTFVQRP